MSKKELQADNNSRTESKFNAAVAALKKVQTDINHVQVIANASLFGSEIDKRTQEVSKDVASIVSKADQGILNLKEVTFMSHAITELLQLIIQAKMKNPLIPSDLVDAITTSEMDAKEALKLTQQVLE
jgi:hypothetical protein